MTNNMQKACLSGYVNGKVVYVPPSFRSCAPAQWDSMVVTDIHEGTGKFWEPIRGLECLSP